MMPAVTITGVFLGVMTLAVPVAQFAVDAVFRLCGV